MSDRKLLIICDKKTFEEESSPSIVNVLPSEIRDNKIWTINVLFNNILLDEKRSLSKFTYKSCPVCVYNKNYLLYKDCDILLYKGWFDVVYDVWFDYNETKFKIDQFLNFLEENNCRVIGDKGMITDKWWEVFGTCRKVVLESNKRIVSRFELMDI